MRKLRYDFRIARIEKDIEKWCQQGKIHQPENNEKENINDVFRNVVMVGFGKSEQAKKNFHVLLQFRLQASKLR